jgi:hypothetical protein
MVYCHTKIQKKFGYISEGLWNGKCLEFLRPFGIFYAKPFGIFYCQFVIVWPIGISRTPFWYKVLRRIWQPCHKMSLKAWMEMKIHSERRYKNFCILNSEFE